MPSSFASQFLVNGLLGVIEWWISSDMSCSADDVTERLLTILKPFTDFIPA